MELLRNPDGISAIEEADATVLEREPDATASEDPISMSSVSQFAHANSPVDDLSIQKLDGITTEASATPEPDALQEASAAGDAIVQLPTFSGNPDTEAACNPGVDACDMHEMGHWDVETPTVHESLEHEELPAVDGLPASSPYVKPISSFDDAASSAQPMLQNTQPSSGEPAIDLSSALREEGSRDVSMMDWSIAEEPHASLVVEEGIIEDGNLMQTAVETTNAIDAMLSNTTGDGLPLVEHNEDLQNQKAEVTTLSDPVTVVEPAPLVRESETPAATINAIDLFASVSIRELQNMLMDSSLKCPDIAISNHTMGVERVDNSSGIAVAPGPPSNSLGDTKMSESASVDKGEGKQEHLVALVSGNSSNSSRSKDPADEMLVAGESTPQAKDCFAINISHNSERDMAVESFDCSSYSNPADNGGVLKLQNTDTENKPGMPTENGIEKAQGPELMQETEEERACKDPISVPSKAEAGADQSMDIDKHVQSPVVSFWDEDNKDLQRGPEDVPADDVIAEPQQSRKRGRKPGKKVVKRLEKDASTGFLQESEPEKDTGDSPLKHSLEGDQKRELRKRGRKPGTAKTMQKEEEDVCFVCFDGGKLILCDKRSCPKAYHVECTGRESEFFEKKGQWFCGWHVCSQCSKSASLNCYMCPSALCSTCIKGAKFLSIRKGHGLCENCYPLVHMIEYNETVKGEPVEVDFNDKETYEGLFKEYWEELKLKQSLSSSDFKEACKVRDAGGVSGEGDINNDEGGINDDADGNLRDENGNSTDSEDQPPTTRHARLMKRKRLTRHSVPEDVSASEFEEDESDEEVKVESTPRKGRTRAPEFDGWASKELLDLIQSLKEDPKKPLPLFGVKKLLWRYIDDNKLINPRRRGQIICDERLRKLFGKKNVGRFEMMTLISLHVASPNKLMAFRGRELQFNESDAVELDDIEENQLGKRKARRKGDDKRFKPDPSEYAAINVKNINLIYLKRSVLDELRNDPELESKAVGAFVRIRVPGSGNKSDACYRLVQVVGVKQIYDALDPEKVTDVILEILNLHKREEVTADLVSNQEILEEECRRLRQSVRCGFIKAIRVGELEERARALREAKVKDWRENELLRLSHLRDRASEKGRKKELRECVEKLQLLSTPEEKERLLNAPFDIDADPFMDPDYESDEEELPADDEPVETNAPQSTQEKPFFTRYPDKGNNLGAAEKFYNWDSGNVLEAHKSIHDTQQRTFSWGQKDLNDNVSMRQTADVQAQNFNSVPHTPTDKNSLLGQGKVGWGDGIRVRDQGTGWNQGSFGRKEARWTGNTGGNVQGSSGGWRKPENLGVLPRNQAEASGPVLSPIQTPAPAPVVAGSSSMVVDSEKERVWCYQDPTRTVQGPFTMEQLRKWEKTNLFPLDLRIWRVNETQNASILLSDALAGRFASRGSLGPSQTPNLLPGSAHGTHVNGIPVQGLNANNFSVGQNGGVITSGVAQGILTSPMPPPQRPIIQGHPSAVQGPNTHNFPQGPIQGATAQGFSSAPVHPPNVHGFPSVPTQGTNVHVFPPVHAQGPFVNNFSAAPPQGTTFNNNLSGPMQGPNATGYPPNVAQGVTVLSGQVQAPMTMQGRPQGSNIALGQMQGPNVHQGQSQVPNAMQGPHFNNAHMGHPRGPHVNHFHMGAAPGAVHNSAPPMGQIASNATIDFRNAQRQSNEWQETGRRSGPDQHFGGPPSNMVEAANEGGVRVIPTRNPWRQGPNTSRQEHRDAHNRGQFGRPHNFRGSDHFQGNDGRFPPRKDLACKYHVRGLCKKGQACDFRHE